MVEIGFRRPRLAPQVPVLEVPAAGRVRVRAQVCHRLDPETVDLSYGGAFAISTATMHMLSRMCVYIYVETDAFVSVLSPQDLLWEIDRVHMSSSAEVRFHWCTTQLFDHVFATTVRSSRRTSKMLRSLGMYVGGPSSTL